MKNIIIFSAILSFAIVSMHAQQNANYTNFMFNKLAFNPAYAGSTDFLTTSAIYKNQWSGIDGAPKTLNFNIHTPFFNKKCGAGLSISNDVTGLIKSSGINLSYNYRLPLGAGSTLAMGIMGSLESSRIDWQAVETVDDMDQRIGMDPVENRIKPNFGMGVYLTNNSYFVGLSVPQLLKTSLYSDSYGESNVTRTSYLMGGFVGRINAKLKIKPSVLLSYNPNAPFEMDLNLNFIFLDSFWLGSSLRLGDSVDGILAYQFNTQLRAGVAVDFTLSELRNHTSGGIELMLQYSILNKEDGIDNLRYF